MSYAFEPLKKYAQFSGRSRRAEYWQYALFVGIAYVVLLVLALASKSSVVYGLIVVFYLGVLVPSLAVGVRRLHDTGKSGWWLLFGVIPLVGPITLLVFTCLDSQPGPNQYGPNPKEPAPVGYAG
ncbi:DUF805 domain-containing protein [Streptomyces sp. NPDC005648]|uniref:DUF805 domain-containing protein n=1 Tax=Streptomyces sp. NPDC005648 TaxID=3157044 RepID=UPI00339E96E7